MALIDTNALREYYKINEHCEECHWNSRDCSKPPYYSLRDICEAIDEIPIIDAIPVEWLKEHDSKGNEYGRRYITVVDALSMWQKEQEAQDGNL